MSFIFKRNYIILAASIFLGVAVGAFLIALVSGMTTDSIKKNNAEREALAASALYEILPPDTDGFDLNILCDKKAAPSFTADEDGALSLSGRVYKRNKHLMAESGADINTIFTPDFYTEATADIQSGSCIYNLYAADAAGSLSKLLATGVLQDVSQSPYINTDEPWYDKTVMEELSLYGKQFLISSSALDARQGAFAVVYNRVLENERENSQGSEQYLVAEAIDGQFTFETLLRSSRTAMQTYGIAETDALSIASDENFYGCSISKNDLFALYFGGGGSFIISAEEPLSVEPLDTLKTKLQTVIDFIADESVSQNASLFGEAGAMFGICRLSDIATLKSSVSDIGLLPLPKSAAEDEYRTFINLDGTPLLAIPRLANDTDKTEYLVSRMAFLSHGYIAPLVRDNITLGNAEDEQILDLLYDNAECDLSNLFGYGDIPSLFYGAVESGTADGITLAYYNRITLYGKAIEIIQKRVEANTAE